MIKKFEIKYWEAYKIFFCVLWGVYKKKVIKEMKQKGLTFPENADPLLFLEPRPGETRNQAFLGLKQAIQDSLEDTKEMSVEELKEIDALLKKAGAPSLGEVRGLIWNEIPKIVKRGKIRNDTEFYLINEKVVGSNEFTEEERAILNKLMEEYELRKQKRGSK